MKKNIIVGIIICISLAIFVVKLSSLPQNSNKLLNNTAATNMIKESSLPQNSNKLLNNTAVTNAIKESSLPQNSNKILDDTAATNVIKVFLSSDGGPAELAADDMYNFYLKNPLEFFSAVDKLDNESQKMVEYVIADEFNYNNVNIETFKNLQNNSDYKKYTVLINDIAKSYGKISNDRNTQTTGHDTNIEDYDIDGLKKELNFYKNLNWDPNVHTAAYLTQKYNENSKLFAKALDEMNDNDIGIIAENIVYVEKINGFDVNSLQNETENESLQIDLSNDENKKLDFLKSQIVQDFDKDLSRFSVDYFIPTISKMNYSDKTIAGETATLNVDFVQNNQNILRTYYAQVYIIQDGKKYLKTSKSFDIPINENTITIPFSYKLQNAGSFYTLVQVYSKEGGSLLVERQGKYPDTAQDKN